MLPVTVGPMDSSVTVRPVATHRCTGGGGGAAVVSSEFQGASMVAFLRACRMGRATTATKGGRVMTNRAVLVRVVALMVIAGGGGCLLDTDSSPERMGTEQQASIDTTTRKKVTD